MDNARAALSRTAQRAITCLGLLCMALAWPAAAWAAPLTVAVSKGTVSLPFYVAESAGLFAREQLEVRTVDCSSGRDCFRRMLDGGADVATAAELVATLHGFTAPDVALIATVSTSSHQIKLIGRRSRGTTSPTGLVGRRVGTVMGSSAQYFLDSWLLFHDLAPEHAVALGFAPDDLVPAVLRGDVDAVAIWEPIASAVVRALGDDAEVLSSPRVYTQHFSLAARRTTLAARDDDLARLLRALIRAERLIADDPARAATILSQRLGLTVAAARAQLRDHDFRIRLDQTLMNTLSGQARWAVRSGQARRTSRPADVSTLVAPALLRRVAPGAVTIAQ